MSASMPPPPPIASIFMQRDVYSYSLHCTKAAFFLDMLHRHNAIRSR
jgi:hypothetical protein